MQIQPGLLGPGLLILNFRTGRTCQTGQTCPTGRISLYKKSPGGVAFGASEGAVTYFSTFAVSSAWRGLTSLFGMGRGGAPALWPP